MRIHVLVSDTLAHGGIQHFNRALIQELRAAVSETDRVRVFSLNDPPAADFHGFNRRKSDFARAALMAAATEQPDVVLLGHVNFSPLAIAYRIAGRSCRTFVIAYGKEVEERRTWPWLLGLHAANGIICISESTQRFVSSVQRIPYRRTHLLHFGLPAIEGDVPAETRSRNGSIELLVVSRLDQREPLKGVDVAIEAVALLRDTLPGLRCTIAGDGDDRPRLDRLVERLDLGDRVSFKGAVDNRSLSRMYDEADIFVLPSALEGFGIVYLEAMAHGKPVIALRRGGTPDVVVHEANGLLLDEQTPEEVAAAIFRLAADAPLRRRLGEFGRTVTVPTFSRERMRAALATILGITDTNSDIPSFRITA